MELRGFLRKKLKGKKEASYPEFTIRENRLFFPLPTPEDPKKLDIEYPLLEPFVSARIKWSPEKKEPVYILLEPNLSKKEQEKLDKIEEILTESIDVKMAAPENETEDMKYLESRVQEVVEESNIDLGKKEYIKIMYYIYRDFIGLNEIEPLMHDPYIEDIGCPGLDTPVYVVHRKFGSMETNVIFQDADYLNNFVIKLSERCGRYISYASPLLDGTLPDGSRVQASMAKDVTTKGPTFSIRKFRKSPFSPVDIINLDTASPALIAYLWLLIEHGSSMLVCGGVASGKTTLLNALSLFIPPEDKIISIEDSVTGDSSILAEIEGEVKELNIENLYDIYHEKTDDVKVMTLDDDHTINWVQPGNILRHSVDKDVYEVKTHTGRRVKVTKDHSLFTLEGGELRETKPTELREGDFVSVNRNIPSDNKRKRSIKLIDSLEHFKEDYLVGELIKKKLKKLNYEDLEPFISYPTFNNWKREGKIKISVLKKLSEEGKFRLGKKGISDLVIKNWAGNSLPVKIPLTLSFLKFLGLWLGDGSYDNHNQNRVIISNSDEECIQLAEETADRFYMNTSKMSDGTSITLNSTLFYKFMKYVIGADGYSNSKKVPDFIFDLSPKQIKAFLKGYFSADGGVKNYEVSCTSQSLELLDDIQTLLLYFGIVSRIGEQREDKCYELAFSSYKNISKFRNIRFLQKRKNKSLDKICRYGQHHDHSDVIPLDEKLLKKINKLEYLSWPYQQGMQNIGREYLSRIAVNDSNPGTVKKLAHSDIFWDKVKSVRKLERKNRKVYDVSVPGTEKFICSNFILHNTREINIEHENWIPAVTRTGFGAPESGGKKYGEISLFDLLKESFRMKPDYVLVGEVRGEEAYVMFQGISSGHPSLATIHAGSVEDVMKRLSTPPIELSPSLLESLDAIVVMINAKEKGESARRIKNVAEIESVDSETKKARTITTFSWIPSSDSFRDNTHQSQLLRRISFDMGAPYEEVRKELKRRERVIRWMVRHGVAQFEDMYSLVNLYYKDKKSVMEMVNKDIPPEESKVRKYFKRMESATGLKVWEGD